MPGRRTRTGGRLRFVTYNIHYSQGKDGRYDLARIADEVRGADVIALGRRAITRILS